MNNSTRKDQPPDQAPAGSADEKQRKRITELESMVTLLELENRHLRKIARQADSANKAKSDFLAMISHEIRTPMNGVIGITELLLDTELQSRQRYFAELILGSARNLLTLINSLLDFSKIEANKMVLEEEQFNLSELLGEIMALYEVSGRQKGLFIRADIDRRLAAAYVGDSYRIRQILVNLLGNAIKFTDRGGVGLTVRLEERGPEADRLRFEVADTGLGIVPEKLDQLFLPFSQVDSSTTRRHGGTGLGLSICSRLVELMGGHIDVKSTPGEGSTFWFVISMPRVGEGGDDAEQAAEPEAGPAVVAVRDGTGEEKAGRREGAAILIVDDDDTNRVLLEQSFRDNDVRLSMARNGREAVEICRDTDFDLIFMDCQMPVMDGFEAATSISEMLRSRGRKRPVIIALTADVTESTRKRCREVNMDDYLVKPLDFGELQRVLDNWLTGYGLRVTPRHRLATGSGTDGEAAGGKEVVRRASIEKLRNNIGDIRPVITVFLSTMRTRLDEMEQAIADKDIETIQRTAHTLKGSSSQFGAEGLSALCQQAENMARSNNLQQIEPLFRKITRVADQVAFFLHEQLD
ncbi:MAG TPA: response regulator [Desulfobulbus sp.]|nr:response regulator [Desulfobulbus sp.]